MKIAVVGFLITSIGIITIIVDSVIKSENNIKTYKIEVYSKDASGNKTQLTSTIFDSKNGNLNTNNHFYWIEVKELK
ncbi:MAG: hypothetical protein RLZZ181_1004 [Pseudomonadota bacterium]|jgi:hypothetical protein